MRASASAGRHTNFCLPSRELSSFHDFLPPPILPSPRRLKRFQGNPNIIATTTDFLGAADAPFFFGGIVFV